MNRRDLSIVLVEPQSPGNVGMVCRAMKNMGLSDLRLVNPCRTDDLEAIKFAVSARDLLEAATLFPSLEAALADTVASVATTRRHGKYRQEIHSPEHIVRRVDSLPQEGRTALVFGREDSGLTTEEVALCRWQATIPTAEFGSLNLAQAVLIFCYEFFRTAPLTVTEATSRPLAATGETEGLYRQMEETLLRIGFLNPENPAHLMRSLRRIFARAELDSREVAILRGMMSQVDWAADSFEGKKKR